MPRSVTVLAPAKINLFLQILGKRPDGYHDIHSLIQTVDLYDTIQVTESSSGIALSCNDPSLPSDSSNLAWRAARLALDRAQINSGVVIELQKRIPSGAGLGGGSSDAAAVIKAVNELYSLRLTNAQMAGWGAELGSDVPFFFSSGSALVEGRGEIVEPVDVFMGYFVLLIIPDFPISTKDAYQGLRLFLTNFSRRRDIDTKASGAFFFKTLYRIGNDFQQQAVTTHPALESCMKVLHRGGAGYVALSGSGSAFFGLFEQRPDRELMTAVSSQFGWQVLCLSPVRFTQN
jgi:4-diphosphocytidyl-2-C-methyl-D-erythritol kinase